MTARQGLLDLAVPPRLGREDFLPSASNVAGLAAIDRWRDWPLGRCLLLGPDGSGRSHLLAIWASDTGAARLAAGSLPAGMPDTAGWAVDDAEAVAGDPDAEEALFHLVERSRRLRRPLLLAAKAPPGTWGLNLPDLESRLQATHTARLDRPDDALMRAALVKLCDERQLAIAPAVIEYLATRLDRSLSEARQVVAALDHAAIARQKRVSRVLAAEILAARAI